MKRIPLIRDVVSMVKAAAVAEPQTKVASKTPEVALTTDVGRQLYDLAQTLKTASPEEITMDDVVALGQRIVGAS